MDKTFKESAFSKSFLGHIDLINFSIYYQSTSSIKPAKAKKGKKRGRMKYKKKCRGEKLLFGKRKSIFDNFMKVLF